MTLGINVSGQARPKDDGATKKRAHEARTPREKRAEKGDSFDVMPALHVTPAQRAGIEQAIRQAIAQAAADPDGAEGYVEHYAGCIESLFAPRYRRGAARTAHASEILDRAEAMDAMVGDIEEAAHAGDPTSTRQAIRNVAQEVHHAHDAASRWMEAAPQANGRRG